MTVESGAYESPTSHVSNGKLGYCGSTTNLKNKYIMGYIFKKVIVTVLGTNGFRISFL